MTALARMLVIIPATLLVMKVLTLAMARAHGTLIGPRAMAEYLGWPGMRPELFAKRRTRDERAAIDMAMHGARMFIAGAALFVAARSVAKMAPPIVVMLIALPALSMMLHFGLFDIMAGVYRWLGVPVGPLFRAPLRARSLSEFWSRRWNIGFSEMIALVVYRPLRRYAGDHAALAGSFLASGLLHELAISVPVRAGYGLPTLYFLLHGALVAFERTRPRPLGRAWTLFWLAAPLPLLFHPPFLRGVIWPLVSLR